MLKLIWPLLIVFGMLFVLFFDVGNGLDSPGFWLIPIGVIGGLVSMFHETSSRKQVRPKKNDLLLIGVWLGAFFCIGSLYFGWFTEGFGTFIYLWPAIILTVLGLVLLTLRLVRR